MRFKRAFLLLSLLSLAATTLAKDFSQADLEKIVSELDPAIPHNEHFKYPIKCSIVAKDEVNAYATVTKEGTDLRATMVVFTGFVKAAHDDETLIRACVAHELSHLSKGHMTDLDPAARDLRNLWTRQQEFEADKFGAEALVKTGHPRKDMVNLLMLLDSLRSRDGGWLERLSADHADPKARAAEVSDNPDALKALVTFDLALAYEDARSHLYAKKLFDAAAAQWPALTEAHINSAKCSLLYYYDNLPIAVRNSWWRPDFGGLITEVHAPPPQATVVSDEDRQAWKDALEATKIAVAKNPDSEDAAELMALVKVMEPDVKKDVVQEGIDWFKSHKSTDSVVTLRYANNAGVGYQRMGDLDTAYSTIMTAQKGTTKFNSALGENLGLVVVNGRSKDDDLLAANVLFTWLNNTPDDSPRYKTVKKTFEDICTKSGLQAKEIKPAPGYLCKVVTLVTSNKNLGLFLPVSGLKQLLGAPDKELVFADKWPDLTEVRWHDGKLTVLTERGRVMRITSYEDGAYLSLKPKDATSQDAYQIKVGMTKAELFAILNEKASIMKDMADGGKVKNWNYFPGLNMGVLIENDKVVAITVSPVQQEE